MLHTGRWRIAVALTALAAVPAVAVQGELLEFGCASFHGFFYAPSAGVQAQIPNGFAASMAAGQLVAVHVAAQRCPNAEVGGAPVGASTWMGTDVQVIPPDPYLGANVDFYTVPHFTASNAEVADQLAAWGMGAQGAVDLTQTFLPSASAHHGTVEVGGAQLDLVTAGYGDFKFNNGYVVRFFSRAEDGSVGHVVDATFHPTTRQDAVSVAAMMPPLYTIPALAGPGNAQVSPAGAATSTWVEQFP